MGNSEYVIGLSDDAVEFHVPQLPTAEPSVKGMTDTGLPIPVRVTVPGRTVRVGTPPKAKGRGIATIAAECRRAFHGLVSLSRFNVFFALHPPWKGQALEQIISLVPYKVPYQVLGDLTGSITFR